MSTALEVAGQRRVDELLTELESNALDLTLTHRELGQVLLAEKQAKITGFAQSDSRTISERDNAGAVQALEDTLEVFRLRAKIAGLEARRHFLTVALQLPVAV